MKRGQIYSLGVALLALLAIAWSAMRITLAQAIAPGGLPPVATNPTDASKPAAPPQIALPAPRSDSAPAAIPFSGGGDVLVAPVPSEDAVPVAPAAGNVLVAPPGGAGHPPIATGVGDVPPGAGRAIISVPVAGPAPLGGGGLNVFGGGPPPAPYGLPVPHPQYAPPLRFAADPELAKLEHQVVELAQRAKGTPADESQRGQLKAALEKAFDRRLALQAEEAQALRERLAKVEAALEKRKSLREKIVELRLQQLVTDPELEWDASAGRVWPVPSPNPFGTTEPGMPGIPTATPNPAGGLPELLGPPLTPPISDERNAPETGASSGELVLSLTPTASSFNGRTDAAAGGSRDWLSSMGTLRDRVEAARDQVASDNDIIRSADELKGANGLTKLKSQEAASARERLRKAQRQLDNALAQVKTVVRLWELEMDSAKLSLAVASERLQRAEEQYKAGLVPASERESAMLAATHAKIRIQQLEEILGAYQQLLADDPPAAAEQPTTDKKPLDPAAGDDSTSTSPGR